VSNKIKIHASAHTLDVLHCGELIGEGQSVISRTSDPSSPGVMGLLLRGYKRSLYNWFCSESLPESEFPGK